MAVESNFVITKNNVAMNVGKICRFCLNKTQNHLSIKDKCLPEGLPEIEQDTIYSFLTKLNMIKMKNAENFPTLVCKNCYKIIKIWYNFVQKCQKSENILNSFSEGFGKKGSRKVNHINNITIKVPNKNLDDSNLKTNNLTVKKFGIGVKTQDIKVENEINFISEVMRYPENLKCNNFLGSVNLALENERLFHVCTHEKSCKNKYTEQETCFIQCKTVFKKQVSEKCKENIIYLKNFVQPDMDKLFCVHCSPCKEFKTKEELFEHMKCHEIKDTYSCPYCEDKFFSLLSYNQHLIDFHNLIADSVKLLKHDQRNINREDDTLIKLLPDFLNFNKIKSSTFCKSCNLLVNFTTANDLKNHIKSHHSKAEPTRNFATKEKTELENDSKWKCSYCSAIYSQKQSLFSHMRLKHNKHYPVSIKCPVCSETFLTNRKVIQHGITAHQKYFANFHNVFNKIIQTSQKKVIQNKNFECGMCQKRYIFKTSLKKHIFSIHLKETKGSVDCSYCGKTLTNKLNLKSHIEFKHEALFVSCPICKKKINFRTIGRHYKIHKNTSKVGLENSYLCNQCGKILKSNRSFEDHQKLHKNIRNELCDVCGSGYVTKKALQLHKKTHEGLQRKLHECDQCHKIFSGRHTLNRHLLTHSGVKNFICEICSKCFYTLQELNRHVRYHKKEYKFECKQCDMRFVDKSRFRHHLMKHKNIRPHKCQFCGKMFIVRGKMNLHMASKHNFQGDSSRIWKDPKTYIPLDKLL